MDLFSGIQISIIDVEEEGFTLKCLFEGTNLIYTSAALAGLVKLFIISVTCCFLQRKKKAQSKTRRSVFNGMEMGHIQQIEDNIETSMQGFTPIMIPAPPLTSLINQLD